MRINSDLNISYKAWLSWLLAITFIFYQFSLQVSPSVMLQAMEKTYYTNVSGIGSISSAFYYAFAVMLLPVGWLMDRYNKKFLFALGISFCVAGCLVVAFSNSFLQGYLGRVLMGIGGSFAFVGTMRLVSTLFPREIAGILSGLTIASAMLGAIFGQDILYLLVNSLGWRNTLIYLSAFGIVHSVLILAFLQSDLKSGTKHNNFSLFASLSDIMKVKDNWKVGLYAGLIYIPLPTFAGLWAPSFLTHVYSINYVQALGAASLTWVGMAFGSPLLGWLSDKSNITRKLMMLSAVMVSLLFLMLVFKLNANAFYLHITFFLIGFFCGAYSLSFVILRQVNEPKNSALSVGFVMTIVMVVTATATEIIGVVLNIFNNSQLLVEQNYVVEYKSAILIIPMLVIISLVASFMLPKGKKRLVV